MRSAALFVLVVGMSGMSIGQNADQGTNQDTNFSVGPQYLITTSSTLLLHPIATPSLSLSAPLPAISSPVAEASPEPASPFAATNPPSLARIFWGAKESSDHVGETVSEIEISSARISGTLPESILNTGVTGMTTAQSLRERGIGVSLAESAASWRAHKTHALRVYTNADVRGLHHD